VGTARRWSGWLTTIVFACYVNYLPVHLTLTVHQDHIVPARAGSVFHLHEHHDAADPNHQDEHPPHPGSDHALTFLSQRQASLAALSIAFIPSDPSVWLDLPDFHLRLPICERVKPPGESPPSPAQPRAPPAA
jgi:hypothetical protein